MKNNKKHIKFAPHKTVDFASIPLPAKKYLPRWYIDIKPTTHPGRLTFKSNLANTDGDPAKTMKMCMPFGDSMMSGYILETWCDIDIVKNGEDDFGFDWAQPDWQIFSGRADKAADHIVIPDNYYKKALSFLNPIYIKTPPGYSCLITQPFNRFDLPFLGLTGIVDTDKEPLFPGNYPMFLNKNFSGLIKSGTPLIQIFPFKREDWVSEEDESLPKYGEKARKRAMSVISRWYKDNAWAKKSYE